MSGYDLVTDSPTKRIYEAVKRIPKGHVATYGKIAEMAGDHRMARAVGNALHKNPDPEHIQSVIFCGQFIHAILFLSLIHISGTTTPASLLFSFVDWIKSIDL